MAQKRVLLVITNNQSVGGCGGWYLPELLHPLLAFRTAGVQTNYASPNGGRTFVDPSSIDSCGEEGKQFLAEDAKSPQGTAHTLPLAECKVEDYDGIFFVGGFGVMYDFPQSGAVASAIENFYNAGKPVAAVCHGPICFYGAKGPDGEPLVKGKKMTAFCNNEEEAVNKLDKLPDWPEGRTCEDILTSLGAEFSFGPNWGEHVIHDGLVITGQNPASAKKTAETLIASL